jgi:hypothetical protein
MGFEAKLSVDEEGRASWACTDFDDTSDPEDLEEVLRLRRRKERPRDRQGDRETQIHGWTAADESQTVEEGKFRRAQTLSSIALGTVELFCAAPCQESRFVPLSPSQPSRGTVGQRAQALRPAKQSVDAVVETFQQDDISEAITSGNSAVRTIPGLDPAIHPPAKEMDPRVEPGVTDVMHS